MNFQDLLAKMKVLDEAEELPQVPTVPSNDTPTTPVEAPVEECGDMPPQSAEPKSQPANGDMLFGEEDMEECGLPGMGSMPSGMMGTPKQSDSVSMSLNMNGQGAGGIRDLMDILRNIEKGADHGDDALLGGEPAEIVLGVEESGNDGGFGQATTKPDTHTYGVDKMTAMGNDIHSQGDEAPIVNGGGNPLAETLMARLSAHYQSIKEQQ